MTAAVRHASGTARTPEAVDRSTARRADRLNARSVLWRESSLERVRDCGRRIVPGCDGVTIRVSGSVADGTRSAGFSGVETCGSTWACPFCSSKIAAGRQADLTVAMRRWQARGGGFVVGTFTMRHRRGQSLTTLWDAVSVAWQRTTGGSGWKADQQLWGFPMVRTIKSGKRAGDQTWEMRIPSVRVVEVTFGKNGWHVHIHCVLFIRHEVTDATADELGRRMFGRWKSALDKLGFSPADECHDSRCPSAGTEHGHGFDAHAPTGDAVADTFGEYFTKSTFDGLSGAAMDATRSDLKSAKNGNRTPFHVLRGITGHAEYVDGDAEVWGEWERGSRNRRQMTWSPGLRELLAFGEEATDQELAEFDAGGTSLVVIAKSSWYALCARPGFQALLLELAEADDTGDLLRLCFQLEGVKHDWRQALP